MAVKKTKTAAGDRADACGTIQEVRRDQFEPVLGAMLIFADETATSEETAAAAQKLQTGLAATTLSTAAGEGVVAAGHNAEQLANILEPSGFVDAETAILELCRDTWQDQR